MKSPRPGRRSTRSTSAGSASRVTTPHAAASAASTNPPVMSIVLVRADPEVLDEARAVLERQAVAERAGDRHAEAGQRASTRAGRRPARSRSRRRPRSPPPGRSSERPPARAAPRHDSRRRSYSRPSSRVEKRRELADVRAGAEHPTGRANDECAKTGIRVDALAGVGRARRTSPTSSRSRPPAG